MKIVLKLELADEELRAIEFDRSTKFRKPSKAEAKGWLTNAFNDAIQTALHNYLDNPDVRKRRAKLRITQKAKENGGNFWGKPSEKVVATCGTDSALDKFIN
jgi:hypothetical protein